MAEVARVRIIVDCIRGSFEVEMESGENAFGEQGPIDRLVDRAVESVKRAYGDK